MAGYIIENLSEGVTRHYSLEDLESLPRDGSVTLLDTRTPGEYARGHVDGFINIPVDDLRDHIQELDPEKPVYVMCQSGLRSYIASRILEGYGFKTFNFPGGYRYYEIVKNDRQLVQSAAPCGMDQ